MSIRRLPPSLAAFVGALLVGLLLSRAEASMPSRGAEPFAEAPVFADVELVQMRGGFAAPFGLEIEFGVLTRTLIDGEMVFETMLSFSGDGVPPIGPAALSSIERAVPGLAISADKASDAGVMAGLGQASFAGGSGAVFMDGNGTITGIVQAAPDRVLNLLASIGMNQQIDQQLNLIFAVKGFAGFQESLRAAGAANRLLTLAIQP